MARARNQTWNEVYACHFVVDLDEGRITLYNDFDELDYCKVCVSPEGRRWKFDPDDCLGMDPVSLLSTKEHQTLERLLKEL